MDFDLRGYNSVRRVEMLVFTDLGLKKDAKIGDRMICVSVVIFKQVRYKQFVRPWERMLKAWNATAFHATDFYNGAGEFKRKGDAKREALFADDSKRIPTMIGKTIRRAILVAFLDDYRKRISGAILRGVNMECGIRVAEKEGIRYACKSCRSVNQASSPRRWASIFPN